jgi:hypothetical protein
MLYQENQQEQLQYNNLPQQLWLKFDKDLVNRLINAAYHTFDESSENNLKQFWFSRNKCGGLKRLPLLA